MKKYIFIVLIVFIFAGSPVFADSFDPFIYKDNYQQEINRLKKLPQTDDIKSKIDILMYYRIRKIATNLELYEKYFTEEDYAYMNGVDIACFSDNPATANMKDNLFVWDKTGWTYDEETQSWTREWEGK